MPKVSFLRTAIIASVVITIVVITLGVLIDFNHKINSLDKNIDESADMAYKEVANLCSGRTLCVTDEVTQIVDGDTLYTREYKIRLALTNTPERNQAGFAEATAFTQRLCSVGSTILIDQDDGQRTDPYGRIVAKVICGGTNLNAELLENNHAYILEQYCAKSEFSSEPWAKKFGC